MPTNDPAILGQFARSKFIPAKNSDYAPVEEVGKVNAAGMSGFAINSQSEIAGGTF